MRLKVVVLVLVLVLFLVRLLLLPVGLKMSNAEIEKNSLMKLL